MEPARKKIQNVSNEHTTTLMVKPLKVRFIQSELERGMVKKEERGIEREESMEIDFENIKIVMHTFNKVCS